MNVRQRDLVIALLRDERDLLTQFASAVESTAADEAIALRFAVTASLSGDCRCDVIELVRGIGEHERRPASIFRFRKRTHEKAQSFNAVFLVPTGIGAELGGHAGDATPAARLLAEVCDTLITHPNVVNASDINEMPANSLYVEGSVICRLLMGTAGLLLVRQNRVLVILDSHKDEDFVHMGINSVSAARASYGLSCPRVVVMDPPLDLAARYARSGAAAGAVNGLDRVCRVLETYRGEYDAVAMASVISVPPGFHTEYFQSEGRMVNPWGGVEAMLTHAISSLYDVPSAHSPMMESISLAEQDPGVVDPRMAAEAVSLAYLQCILKGLHRSPRIVTDPDVMAQSGIITASDVSCLVIPDGCLGLPTLAALEQGIPVIAVRENRNLMQNDLAVLPWHPDKFFLVDNYWEAAGVLAALKAGITPGSTRRPLTRTTVARFSAQEEQHEKRVAPLGASADSP